MQVFDIPLSSYAWKSRSLSEIEGKTLTHWGKKGSCAPDPPMWCGDDGMLVTRHIIEKESHNVGVNETSSGCAYLLRLKPRAKTHVSKVK